MRTAVRSTVVGCIASPGASALSGIVLRIKPGAVTRGLSLLAGIIVLAEARTATRASASGAAVVTGLARTCYDVGNEADAADECEKCAKAG